MRQLTQNRYGQPLVRVGWALTGVGRDLMAPEDVRRVPTPKGGMVHLVRSDARRMHVGVAVAHRWVEVVNDDGAFIGKHAVGFVRDPKEVGPITKIEAEPKDHGIKWPVREYVGRSELDGNPGIVRASVIYRHLRRFDTCSLRAPKLARDIESPPIGRSDFEDSLWLQGRYVSQDWIEGDVGKSGDVVSLVLGGIASEIRIASSMQKDLLLLVHGTPIPSGGI